MEWTETLFGLNIGITSNIPVSFTENSDGQGEHFLERWNIPKLKDTLCLNSTISSYAMGALPTAIVVNYTSRNTQSPPRPHGFILYVFSLKFR